MKKNSTIQENLFDTVNPPLILIVDDIDKNIQFAANILSKQSYRLAFAKNGKKALEMVKNVNPDLILLDVMMPEMDGFEVCTKLKEDPSTRAIPVIFLTAKTETKDIVQGFDVGAADYVTKPFIAQELTARVKIHLSQKTASDIQNDLISKLQTALNEIKQLTGLLPICSFCKKIRNDKGYWEHLENYITEHSDAKFTHSYCPECIHEHYPEIDLSEE